MPRLTAHLKKPNSSASLLSARVIVSEGQPLRVHSILGDSYYKNEKDEMVHVNKYLFLDELHYCELLLYIAKYLCIKKQLASIEIEELRQRVNNIFNLKSIVRMNQEAIPTAKLIIRTIKTTLKEEKEKKETTQRKMNEMRNKIEGVEAIEKEIKEQL